jgi:hypothetical protein
LVGVTNNLELSVFNGMSTGAAKISPIPTPLLVGDELRNDSMFVKRPIDSAATNKINRKKIERIFDISILYININI